MRLDNSIRLYCQGTPWYGFDLDSTLATWHHGQDVETIGKLIDGEAAAKLRQYLKEGKTCKIVTARVGSTNSPAEQAKQRKMIQKWIKKHFGKTLEVIAEKDADMVELYDDKARQVKENKGDLI